MVDLETLGTNQDSAFISIGACMFDPDSGNIGEQFYQNIDWDDALKTRKATGDTIKWWMRQEKAAQDKACAAGSPLKVVLSAFGNWFTKGRDDRIVWGNGATFDVGMLENAFMSEFGKTPWKFWNVMDVRTTVKLAACTINKNDVPFVGTPHDPLADAIHQAQYISVMWQRLRGQR